MGTGQHAEFGALLRRHRIAAGLSQEALAERAHITAQAVSALERGVRRTPYLATVALLAEALRLPESDRAALVAASRRGAIGEADASASSEEAPHAALQLPVIPVTPLIGRDDEAALVEGLLRGGSARLVTLTGPGGVGKTRLALDIAERLAAHFGDGTAFVTLASLVDASLVASTIAQALGLVEGDTRALEERLASFLREKRLLLVLDNFEHVGVAAPLIAALLGACRGLNVLITSRAPLRLRGEHEVAVAPLALPDPAALTDLVGLAATPAVALFVERARAVKADFALTQENAPHIAAICRRLDGLPLAIELAAPWVKVLAPATLSARLERRLPLLTGGAVDLAPRQRTMRDTIAWSYDLLDADDQRLFRRLSVFVGGCTLEAAAAVCPDDAQAPDAEMVALAGLASLVNKSLLRQEERPAIETRLLMLETVREFGRERLEADDDAEALRLRHASYALVLAEDAEPHLRGPEQQTWLERLEREHDNVRAALRWVSQSAGEAMDARLTLGLRLAAALWQFWYTRGHLGEGRRWLEELLALAEPQKEAVAPAARARALLWAGMFAAEQGEYERATAMCAESDELCGRLGDSWGAAWGLNVRGFIARHQGAHDRAAALYEQSLAHFRRLGDRWCITLLLSNLGALARYQGENARAAALYEESLAIARSMGDTSSIAIVLSNLAELARDRGDAERMAALADESLALFRDLGDTRGIAVSLTYLAVVARERGDYAQALALYKESLVLCRRLDERARIATCLEGLAAVAQALGRAAPAARLLGASDALREAIGAPIPPADRRDYERTVAAVGAALGASLSHEWAAGRAMTQEHVIALALSLEAPALAS